MIDLQQTPASAAKAALKVVVQPAGSIVSTNHVFNFTSPTAARAELEAITDAVRTAITALRSGSAPTAASGTVGQQKDAQSAAMAMASASSSSNSAVEGWYDDQRLKSNVELQQTLLKKDTALRQLFEESLRQKPESITNLQFSLQFWSARLHLLRAHAIERTQSQGAYNVLSEVKPKLVDGVTRLALSKEQIHLIFDQHPLVKHIYNEVVPKLSEMEFWTRFFVSRIFKKLKGERITDADSTDVMLDKYLADNEDPIRTKHATGSHVPHFIDLEGNEQNHSQRKGNAPDITMRPGASDRVPILRVLNNMSEKMMSHVAPADGHRHAPVGMDEETYNELRLRDLQADAKEDRMELSVQDQTDLFVNDNSAETSDETSKYHEQDAKRTLASLQEDLNLYCHTEPRHAGHGLDLPKIIGFHQDSSSDSEADVDNSSRGKVNGKRQATTRVGSHAALSAATSQIFALVSQQRERLNSESLRTSSSPTTSLSDTVMQSLQLTQNTSTEFLHYFWSLLRSAPSSTADRDLPSLTTTLRNSRARIEAIAIEAEKERSTKFADLKRQAAEYQQRSGKKQKLDERMMVGPGFGGRNEVERLMASTVRAIASAEAKYELIYGI